MDNTATRQRLNSEENRLQSMLETVDKQVARLEAAIRSIEEDGSDTRNLHSRLADALEERSRLKGMLSAVRNSERSAILSMAHSAGKFIKQGTNRAAAAWQPADPRKAKKNRFVYYDKSSRTYFTLRPAISAAGEHPHLIDKIVY